MVRLRLRDYNRNNMSKGKQSRENSQGHDVYKTIISETVLKRSQLIQLNSDDLDFATRGDVTTSVYSSTGQIRMAGIEELTPIAAVKSHRSASESADGESCVQHRSWYSLPTSVQLAP
jgi:hypothetical protein